MPDLRFAVTGAEAPPYSAAPNIAFKLAVTNTPEDQRIHSVMLRCQLRIDVTKRAYSPEAKARLFEVFGEPERWRDSLRAFLWTNTTVVVPGFTGETVADMPVPFTYDFEVKAAKYFDALADGEIPLNFLFSGTVFYADASNRLQVEQISWEREASYRLPVAIWREMIARYFPNTAYLRLSKEVFDRLYQYKGAQGLPTWDQTLTRLLDASEGAAETTVGVRADAAVATDVGAAHGNGAVHDEEAR